MKIAFLTTDNREHYRSYSETRPHFAGAVEALLPGFALLDDVEVHVISCAQQTMRSPEKLARNIWFHSLDVPRIGWMRTLYQGCIRATRKKIKELNPDVVHGNGTERDCSFCAVLSGFPSVVTIHGNMIGQMKLHGARIGSYLWLAAQLEKFTVRRTTGVICNSTYTQGWMKPLARKTWLLPHAVRPVFLDPQPDVSTARPCVLLNAGVITPRKRQLELLDVAETLHKRGLRFEFRFIGYASPGNNYAAEFLEKIKPMAAAGYARFVGAVPENELVNCFDSVAAMVHFPTEEAFGNVVVESLARDLKFFGSRLGGIVDIAQDAPGAELFSGGDWNGLTGAIAKWIEHGHPIPQGANAFIRERYSPEIIARRHMEIYRELLSSRARA